MKTKPWALVGAAVIASGAWIASTGEPARDESWWSPNDVRTLAPRHDYANSEGIATTLFENAPSSTEGHPFFASFSANGRACVSCHQPADGMSLSIDSIRKRWRETSGKDP